MSEIPRTVHNRFRLFRIITVCQQSVLFLQIHSAKRLRALTFGINSHPNPSPLIQSTPVYIDNVIVNYSIVSY